MQRFGTMMLEGLTAAGVPAELIQPEPVFGEIRFAGGFIAKWLAYVDKFLIFPRRLRAKLTKRTGSRAYLRSFKRDVFPARWRESRWWLPAMICSRSGAPLGTKLTPRHQARENSCSVGFSMDCATRR